MHYKVLLLDDVKINEEIFIHENANANVLDANTNTLNANTNTLNTNTNTNTNTLEEIIVNVKEENDIVFERINSNQLQEIISQNSQSFENSENSENSHIFIYTDKTITLNNIPDSISVIYKITSISNPTNIDTTILNTLNTLNTLNKNSIYLFDEYESNYVNKKRKYKYKVMFKTSEEFISMLNELRFDTKRKSIGVVVFHNNTGNLEKFTDNINSQTIKPDKIVFVNFCSMSQESQGSQKSQGSQELKEFLETLDNKIDIQFISCNELNLPAVNKNIGLKLLNTDILTFFDTNNIMHPQRIEMILESFSLGNCKIVLHNFSENACVFNYIQNEDKKTLIGMLRCSPTGCAIIPSNFSKLIHHPFCSISKDIKSYFEYREHPQYKDKEDAIFCGDILSFFPKDNVYIENSLSQKL